MIRFLSELIKKNFKDFLAVASSQEWCVTNCDQENGTSRQWNRLCATNQSRDDRQHRGQGAGFVVSTGKKFRKDEELGSKEFRVLFGLLLTLQQSGVEGGMPGQSGWPWAPGWAEERTEPCPVLSKGNIHGLLCQILVGMWQTGSRPAGLHPGLVQPHGTRESFSLPWEGARRAFHGQAPRACAFEQNWVLVCFIERDKVLLLHRWPLSLSI